MEVERLLEVSLSLFEGLPYGVDAKCGGTRDGEASIIFLYDLRLHILQLQAQ